MYLSIMGRLSTNKELMHIDAARTLVRLTYSEVIRPELQ
jgi:hypothetical protein